VTKRCPVCDYVADDANDWRHHLQAAHDWDPSNEPTYVGDFLLAVGLGFLVFLSWGMTGSCGLTRAPASGAALTAWWLVGLVALPMSLLVLAIQPLRRTGYSRSIANRRKRATQPGPRRLTPADRKRLRLINTATTGAMTVGFIGSGIAYNLREENDWWPVLLVAGLLIIAVAAFARAIARKRMLSAGSRARRVRARD
jgi:hypothetical protein